MRDLFVFVILFLLGLAIWTTGLFPAVPAQSPAPAQAQVEQTPAVSETPPSETRPSTGREPVFASDTGSSTPTTTERDDNDSPEPASELSGDGGEDTLSPPRLTEQPNMAITRVMIPSLKVDAQVIEVPFNGVTWDISSLGLDIAQLGEVPGESAGENIVLAGHFSIEFYRNGPFRYISRMAIGEPVQVFTEQMVYTYQVREHALVGEQDERVIASTDQPQLTLLTCETWDEKTGKFLRRRVVYADLVKSEPLGHPIIQ